MRNSRILFLLFLISFGCGSGNDERCTISASKHGIRTITCPNGEVEVPGGGTTVASCVRQKEPEGWSRIVCDDGSSWLVDSDGNPRFPGNGSIAGNVTLWGEEESHADIVVRAMGTPFRAVTDIHGDYRFPDLPAGTYHLVFEYEGRVPEVRPNIPVINGSYRMEPAELRIGRKVSDHSAATTIESPSKEMVLVFDEHWGGALSLLDLSTWEIRVLSQNAATPSFSFDGRKVAWVENLSSRSRVMLFDLPTGKKSEIDAQGIGARFFEDGRAILIRTVAEGRDGLLVYDLTSGEVKDLGSWDVSPLDSLPMGGDGTTVVYHRSDETILYDRLNGREIALADTRLTFTKVWFSPDGRRVVFARQGISGDATRLIAFDLRTDEMEILETSLASSSAAVLPPTRNGSLLWKSTEGWRLREGASRETLALGNEERGDFLPDGAGIIFWSPGLEGAGPADLYLIEDRRRISLAQRAMAFPMVSHDSEYVAVDVDDGAGPETRLHQLAKKTSVNLPGHGWRFHPDSDWLARRSETSELVVADAKTGKAATVVERIGNFGFGGIDLLLFDTRPEEGEIRKLGSWSPGAARLQWLGPGEGDVIASRSGRYLFFTGCLDMSCNVFFRFDRKKDRLEVVEKGVPVPNGPAGNLFDRFLLYRISTDEGSSAGGLYLITGVE